MLTFGSIFGVAYMHVSVNEIHIHSSGSLLYIQSCVFPLLLSSDIMPPVTPNVGSFQDSSESTQYIIIGSAVGGLLLLITVLMVVVITIRVVYKHQHMRSEHQSDKHRRLMQ